MVTSLSELKKKIMRLLSEDEEFRCAVIGLIGLKEILKRLDKYSEELVKLREDMNAGFKRYDEELAKLREDMVKGFERHDKELIKLREDMIAGFRRHDEELAKLREDMNAGFKRYDEELAKLREDMVKGFERHDKELIKLREDFNIMLSEIRSINTRLSRVEKTLERITISEEEEAREVIGYRLRNMGIEVDLDRLQLPGLELNIYGRTEELCIIGEVTTRLGTRIVRELDEKAKLLSLKYPSYLRPKIIKVIYTIIATPEAVKEAKKRSIWVLTWREDLTKYSL